MKIYLATNKSKNINCKWASNLAMLDGMLLDSEGTDIICDDFISSFAYEEIAGLLNKLASKIRIKGKLTIADVDANILSVRTYNQEVAENELNSMLFTNQKRKSIVSLSTIEEKLPKNLDIESKTYDHKTCRFILVARRVK